MSPRKKSGNLVHRPIITNDRQKAIGEYFHSKIQDAEVIKKRPEWDVARVSPAAEVVRSRRELNLAEIALDAKRLQRDAKRKSMDYQWEQLRYKEDLLRQSFIKFNKFVKENNEKRERALRKIDEEKERQEKRQNEIGDLLEKLEYMKSVREKMEKHVKEYKIYQNYLERVVNETGEFEGGLADLFNRYESLIEARISLAQHQDKNLEELEVTGTEMQHMTEAKGQTLMDLNNKLASLQGRYDHAKAKALGWEMTVARVKETTASKNLEITRVKSCCWNMYRQVCKRKGVAVEVGRDNVEDQLTHIKRTILELKKIVKIANKKAKMYQS